MKRWQDRGEVEDSEGDEDLSLDANTPSPERPHKRAKYAKEGSVDWEIPDHTPGSDDEDESNWIQAKVATTYGRRGKVVKQTSAPVSHKNTPAKSIESGTPGHLVVEDQTDSGRNGRHQISREPTPTNITNEKGPTPVSAFAQVNQTLVSISDRPYDSTDVFSATTQIVQPQFSASVLLKRPLQRDEPDIIEANVASEPNQSLSGNTSKALLPVPRKDDFMRLSDLLSSPLSEREVSPPLDFVHHRLDTRASAPEDSDDLSEAESLPQHHDLDAHALAIAANERRSLRVRQEKQLHPYMYDKAQYQKQFRERGLKPVRVVEQDTTNEETQSASHSASSQISVASQMSSSPRSQPLRPPSTALPQLDYFDAAGGSSDNEFGLVNRPTKRRKVDVSNQRRPGQLPIVSSVSRPRGRSTAPDQQSMPLSPPRTSSDIETPSMAARGVRKAMPGFKLPPSRVLGSLPTPQISSDVRPRTMDMESPANSPTGPARIDRRGSDSLSSELSSSESETEALAEAEARRLRREQKRIRGVLPASWLRIDFRKQRVRPSLSPVGNRRLSIEPSPRTEPQKGMARKVFAARARPDGSPGLHGIAGGVSDDSDDSSRGLSALSKQPRLTFENDRLLINPSEAAVDDAEMENDFVDPMLAGISRSVKGKRRKANQPRITDAFQKSTSLREEVQDHGVSRKRAERRTGQPQRRRQARPRPPPTHLSIVDAPRSPSTHGRLLPQFVRVALRRARNGPRRGRHSPTDKVLRLATIDETEEASSVLRAWREGTIAPRRSRSSTRLDPQLISEPAADVDETRTPLSSLPANVYQPRIRATALTKNAARARRPHQGARNRLRQTQIEYPAAEERETNQEQLDQTRDTQPRRKRHMAQQPHLRNAQVETLETEFAQMHREAAFERRMQLLTESAALPERRSRASGFQLARFLNTDDDDVPMDDAPDAGAQTAAAPHAILPHRSRKSKARRLETGTRQYRQPSEPLIDLDIDDNPLQPVVSTSEAVLEGLAPFGTKYSTDFGVEPLALGTFYQHTTFIGSGEFSDALNLFKRDLTCAAGRMRVQLDGDTLEWEAWNEDVAASFVRIPVAISEALQTLQTTDETFDREQQLRAADSNIDYLLRSVLRYCSKCLYFVDTVDRQSCADSLHRLVVDLAETLAEPVASSYALPETIAKALQYGLIVLKQASQIADHRVVSAATRSQITDHMLSMSKRLANVAVIGHFDKLRSIYEDNKHSDKRAAGIDGNAHTLSSVVILANTVCGNESKSLLWPAMCSAMGTDFGQVCAVGHFDRTWYDLFTLLPALEIAATGTACLGSRLSQPQENWSLAQAMLTRVFELYESSSDVRGYSVNDYVRALLTRCNTLVNKWGWWRCESVLNIIYDFFSRRGLALLKKEDSRGSPRFLDQLGSGLVELEVQNDDRSFHIFLKILASGLIGMAKYQMYRDRKIQGIAWRFIPNHNRTYRKDADVERSTLDALRNHHDLICTLYYASPPGHRPGVHLLRELVDHSTSHREACRLNVKSWANIARFQASTSESLEALRPLTSWFADIMQTTVAQYRLARSEAQQAFDQAKAEGAKPSEALLESTVTNNQRQLAATLVDTLAGFKRALNSAGSPETARFLVEETAFWTVFELFDPSQRRLVSSMTEALQVVETALDAEQRSTPMNDSQHASDDSQDFGDSDALQEFVANDDTTPDSVSIFEVLLEPVGHFISNALGADISPDDTLLQKAIDVWVRLAGVTVKHGKKTWLDYVNDYSATGWGQMRDTAQKRKFTTYFMSRVIEQSTSRVELSHHVLTAWLLSLVEREALLKFQHTLTSALLTHFGHDRLLQNLPFAKDSKGEFHITLSELRQRRLALLSCVFCNMREAHDRTGSGKPADAVRLVYENMLRQLMQVMKSNYQELQTTHVGAVADASVQCAYVDFVQQVVSFLQQHITRICRIDSFFTDSTAFPLPSDDPTYVVGRLRGYVPQLQHAKVRKELATFLHTVGERAAVDGQQPYLVKQMSTAMNGVAEDGDRTSPSLRYLLLTTMFPAYIESTFATACSWIQVLPVLQACEQVIPDLIYCVKIEHEDSVMAASESVIAVMHSINQQFEKILDGPPGMIGFAHVLRTLSAMVVVGTSSLSLASLIKRSTSHGLMKHIRPLRELVLETKGRLETPMGMSLFQRSAVADSPVSPWPDTSSYADNQLRGDLQLWHAEDGKYYLKKFGRTQEAATALMDSEEESRRLLRIIDEYCRAYDAIFGLRARRRSAEVSENRWIDDVVV